MSHCFLPLTKYINRKLQLAAELGLEPGTLIWEAGSTRGVLLQGTNAQSAGSILTTKNHNETSGRFGYRKAEFGASMVVWLVKLPTTCDTHIPHERWFQSLLLCFGSSPILMAWESSKGQMFRALPPMWATWMKLLAPDFGLVQPWML